MPTTCPARTTPRLGLARSCYDHPAGTLGVALTDRLLAAGLLVEEGAGYAVRSERADVLAPLGVDVTAALTGRRRAARPCLDWTVRRPHLAGALGAAVFEGLLRAGWMHRTDGSRALAVTGAGRSGLRDSFGITLPDDPTR